MKVKRGILFSLCTLLLSVFYPALTFAHPQINEFSSPTSDDWIEIYNPTESEVDLSLYRIRDNTQSNKLDLSGTLPAKGFVVVTWGSFLNNGGDTIRLLLLSDETDIIDTIMYGTGQEAPLPSGTETAGRKEEAVDEWVIFSEHSKGASNNPAQVFSTPTPTPSPTPTPTRTPTPTNTPTPTRTPTPTKALSLAVLDEEDVISPSIVTSKKKEVEFKPSDYPEAVLSTQSAEQKDEKKPLIKNTLIKDAKDTFQENKITSISVIIGAILLICCGILIFRNQRKLALF